MEVITPLHVGAASEKHYKRGLDYYYDSNAKEVVFINHQLLAKERGDSFIQYLANADYASIQNAVRRDSRYALKRIKLNNDPGGDIKAHIRNGLDGKPIVPGSSIKGAIRSILFNYFNQVDTNQYLIDPSRFKDLTKKSNINPNEEIFGPIADGKSFMRFIKISDAFFDDIQIFTTKIFNPIINHEKEWFGAWKNSGKSSKFFKEDEFITSYEVIKVGEKSFFELMLDTTNFELMLNNEGVGMDNQIHIKKISLIGPDFNNLTKLFSIINDHTKRNIESERDYIWALEDCEYCSKIVSFYDGLLHKKQNVNSCIIRLASGSGFHSITGDWKFSGNHLATFENPDFGPVMQAGKRVVDHIYYKSRKIAFEKTNGSFNFFPMGYVLLTYDPNEQ